MGLSVVEAQRKPWLFVAAVDCLCLQFGVQLVIGVILSTAYRANPLTAHASVAGMHQGAIGLFQAAHYWGSALLILESILLLAYATWQGLYARETRWTFTAAVLFVPCASGFQMTGNLLPFDRHGVQTSAIEAGIGARAPAIGETLRSIALQGSSFSGDTLLFWYRLHWALAVLVLLAFATAILGRRDARSAELKTLKPYNPKTLPWSLGSTALPFLLAALVRSPLGSAAAAADYDAFSAKASWYTWPMHGALVMMDRLHTGFGWIGAMLVPGLAFAAVLLLPWLCPNLPRAAARAVLCVVGAFFAVAALLFGGAFAPLTGTRDPAVVAQTATAPTTPQNAALAAQGRQLFAAQGCSDCHGKDGIKGGAGPSLLKVWTRHSDAQYYERYIHKPQAVDPQSTMPAFDKLSAQDLSAIAEWLRYPRVSQ